MSVGTFNDLLSHVGHRIVCVTYGDRAHPANVAVECEACNKVLLDFDAEEDPAPTTVSGHAFEPEDYEAMRRMAARLCGGPDKVRDEGNLLVVLLNRAVEI